MIRYRKQCLYFAFFLVAAAIIGTFTWLKLGGDFQSSGKPVADIGWAKALEKPGLPNLHKINDALYRGAQPEEKGYEELSKMGIKTIICLRDSDPDLATIRHAKLDCIHIPVKTWHPTKKEVVKFLQSVTDKSKQPIFVHCQHGSDRTGTMCAIYRIAIEGWSKEDAIQEMTKGDFGFHSVWTNLIHFIKDLDVDSIKKAAGLEQERSK